jgi:uncharacterized membrane protein
MKSFAFVLACALAPLAAACSSPSGATCPTTDAPTYTTFGAAFFASYCTSCHSSQATGADRHGAPSDQNFDTEAEIVQHATDIDEEAASGPSATNTDMPELDSDVTAAPSLEERQMLGQFLACEKSAN